MTTCSFTERAEQKKIKAEMEMAMGIIDEEDDEENQPDLGAQEEELKRAMLKPVRLENNNVKPKPKKKRKIKTIHDKAINFSEIIVAIINGLAPFLGGLVPLIPFFFVRNANFITFIQSFIIILLCIIVLGIFIGRVSKESIIINIVQMLFAFTITIIVVLIFIG